MIPLVDWTGTDEHGRTQTADGVAGRHKSENVIVLPVLLLLSVIHRWRHSVCLCCMTVLLLKNISLHILAEEVCIKMGFGIE